MIRVGIYEKEKKLHPTYPLQILLYLVAMLYLLRAYSGALGSMLQKKPDVSQNGHLPSYILFWSWELLYLNCNCARKCNIGWAANYGNSPVTIQILWTRKERRPNQNVRGHNMRLY